MQNLMEGQKIIVLNISMGGRLGYEFHDYSGPHNPNHHASNPAFAEFKCVDPDNAEFVLTRVWNPDLDDAVTTVENGPRAVALHTQDAAFGTMQYFSLRNHHLFNTRRYWLHAEHYIRHLAGIVDEAVMQEDPYLYSKEKFFRTIRELKVSFEGSEVIPHTILDHPKFSIPQSRYEQFCIEYDETKGQRWGQAFYDFMQAHKIVQDAWWWDRLYNAKSGHARSMVRALLDFRN